MCSVDSLVASKVTFRKVASAGLVALAALLLTMHASAADDLSDIEAARNYALQAQRRAEDEQKKAQAASEKARTENGAQFGSIAYGDKGYYWGQKNSAGERDGYGILFYQTGRDEGQFSHDRPIGWGVIIANDGTRYEGEFRGGPSGFSEGYAVYTWPDGTVYQGEFSHDHLNGRGIKTLPNGQAIYGIWQDGALSKEIRTASNLMTPAPTREHSGKNTEDGGSRCLGKPLMICVNHLRNYFNFSDAELNQSLGLLRRVDINGKRIGGNILNLTGRFQGESAGYKTLNLHTVDISFSNDQTVTAVSVNLMRNPAFSETEDEYDQTGLYPAVMIATGNICDDKMSKIDLYKFFQNNVKPKLSYGEAKTEWKSTGVSRTSAQEASGANLTLGARA